jgi:hypothetical protein
VPQMAAVVAFTETSNARVERVATPGATETRLRGSSEKGYCDTQNDRRGGDIVDGLVQIQVVVQGNAGAVGLVGLDTQGRVWYGELSGAKAPARYSIKWTKMEEHS